MSQYELIAKTQFGFEPILSEELKALGAHKVEILNRAVKFVGDDALMYKANLYLRTALKILKPIAWFEANNEQQLYTKMQRIDWSEWMEVNDTFAIEGTTQGNIFTHSQYVALKTKDAIVDQFRARVGKRPSVNTENPDLRINVHIWGNNCTVSLDSTGATLDKRGYRLARTAAPINEVLAAGILLMSGWDAQSDLYDPMCGSGTFAIEAAMMASHIPPGMHRSFTFERWRSCDRALWTKIKKEAAEKILPYQGNIYASDIDSEALEVAKKNAQRAGVADSISFERKDFLASAAKGTKGWIVINPPYGERLEKEEIMAFYKDIGSRCKQHYQGHEAWIISAHLEALKFFGLKPTKKVQLFNGSLECKLHKYELYAGSRG